MTPNFPVNRRAFLAGAGSLFAASLTPWAADALNQSDLLFSAACRRPDGRFAAVLMNGNMEIIREIALPDRGHDVTFNPVSGQSVVFARRPGNFMVVFDRNSLNEPITLTAPEGRHFYGHGVFSPDGRLLYATENDFEDARGMIGIYDASNNFRRLGEFDSHGVGPHDLLLMPDGKTLVIANGGIETHPEYGREKLNLAMMEPSIVYLDRMTGTLIEKHKLSASLHQLSIRHMAMTDKGRVIFGCQYEGSKSDKPPLVGWSELGEGIGVWDCLQDTHCQPANYIGSVAVSQDGVAAAVSAPRDNAFALISVRDGTLLRTEDLSGVCGLASGREGFVASSDQGFCANLHRERFSMRHALAFDNHMASFHGSVLFAAKDEVSAAQL